ncbi:MAG: SMC-Scp complex subunit ScpB [Clostridiales Family XIII bacterium]|nr:SMC-Scp complex subunit ScpB [Clostridiales Family XIII bacterium]
MTLNDREFKSAFESMMFIWGEPLDARTAAEAVGLGADEAYGLFKEIQREYDESGRGLAVREIGGAFQFVTRVENFDYLRRLCTPVKEKRLSQAALETLAIIAYRQPVTKGEIDVIRGVKSERIIEGLAKKELVEEKGRADAVGKPILYGTTAGFLRYFGFESLAELPEIDDIEDALRSAEPDATDEPEQISLSLGGTDE